MVDELKDQRIITLMTPSEVEAIDEWSFANRIRSRGEAIRRLCQLGLTYHEEHKSLLALADQVVDAMRGVSFEMNEKLNTFPADEHFAQVLKLIDVVGDLATEIRQVDNIAQYLSDGDKAKAIDHGEELRVILAEGRRRAESLRKGSNE